jgi:hypothetical protein
MDRGITAAIAATAKRGPHSLRRRVSMTLVWVVVLSVVALGLLVVAQAVIESDLAAGHWDAVDLGR